MDLSQESRGNEDNGNKTRPVGGAKILHFISKYTLRYEDCGADSVEKNKIKKIIRAPGRVGKERYMLQWVTG